MLPPKLRIGIDHLLQRAGLPDHQIIGKQDRERFIVDDVTGAPDGVAQAQRLLLPDRDDFAEAGARWGQRVQALAGLAHRRFQLEARVEIVDQRALARAR